MILKIIMLLLAFPVGFLIARYTSDELVFGRRWFRVLSIVSIIGIIGFWLVEINYLSWTFGFILIVSLISSAEGRKMTDKKKKPYNLKKKEK